MTAALLPYSKKITGKLLKCLSKAHFHILTKLFILSINGFFSSDIYCTKIRQDIKVTKLLFFITIVFAEKFVFGMLQSSLEPKRMRKPSLILSETIKIFSIAVSFRLVVSSTKTTNSFPETVKFVFFQSNVDVEENSGRFLLAGRFSQLTDTIGNQIAVERHVDDATIFIFLEKNYFFWLQLKLKLN